MKPRPIILPKETADARARRAERIAIFLCGLDANKPWELLVRPFKRERSSPQNKYLRGVADVMIAKAIGYDPDEVHEFLCGTYWGWKQEACPKTPSNPRGIKDKPIRTTTTDANGDRDVLNKQDFWDFVDFVQRFGAKHGVYIPDPDPDLAFREVKGKAA